MQAYLMGFHVFDMIHFTHPDTPMEVGMKLTRAMMITLPTATLMTALDSLDLRLKPIIRE